MTTKTTSRTLATDLDRIATDLAAAQEDVALLERLKSATDRVARLTADQEKASKARDKALAVEAKEQDAARFAGLSNVAVTESPETIRESVLRSAWTIRYSKPTWNGRTNPLREHSANSFGSLEPAVLAYLMDKRPDLIPAKIMALAPDNPKQAFGRYFVSCKRGYVAA